MNRYLTVLAVILLFMFPVVIMGLTSAVDVQLGKAVYMKRCKMCHGTDGNGNPAMARMLSVEFKPMSSPEVQALNDASITQLIKKGRGKMAKVRKVTDDDIVQVIAYLRTLK